MGLALRLGLRNPHRTTMELRPQSLVREGPFYSRSTVGKLMDINRFTEKTQEAIRAAQTKATRYSHQQVDVEHLMDALLEQQGGLARSVIVKAGFDADALKRRIEQELERMPKVSGPSGAPEQIYVTARLNRLLANAEDEAKRLKDDFISVEHLLLAATADNGAVGKILKELGITRDRLMQALQDVRGSQRVTTANPEATYEALESTAAI